MSLLNQQWHRHLAGKLSSLFGATNANLNCSVSFCILELERPTILFKFVRPTANARYQLFTMSSSERCLVFFGFSKDQLLDLPALTNMVLILIFGLSVGYLWFGFAHYSFSHRIIDRTAEHQNPRLPKSPSDLQSTWFINLHLELEPTKTFISYIIIK